MPNVTNEIWQELLSLESRDVVSQWFSQIHYRELNARRAKEINASAKQAREYFRNAGSSAYSVRPLLTFYGVACLSRSILLLLRAEGGEESLSASHGLETADWAAVMSGDAAKGLQGLGDLKVRTTNGLFSQFLMQTRNRIPIHINSSNVDWRICYPIPAAGVELSLDDVFSRIPDLQRDYSGLSDVLRYTPVNEMTYNASDGFSAKVKADRFSPFQHVYESCGYSIQANSGWVILKCSASTLQAHTPQFVHTYIQKSFGAIPSLHLAEPFPNGSRFSQLAVTYIVSYILGMLVRYYPTHWVSLIQGEKGDAWWPTINRAQQVVECTLPELAMELITDILNESGESKAVPQKGKNG